MKRARFPEHLWRGGKVPWGEEYFHYPSVLAQDLWLHVFSLGRTQVKLRGGHRHDHENRFLLHYIQKGEFWHSIRGETHRAGAGTVCLMDLREPVRYGNDRVQTASVWWICFGGKDMTRVLSELDAESNPLFPKVNATRIESLFSELLPMTRRPPLAYEAKATGILSLMLAELFAVRATEHDFDMDLVEMPRRRDQLSRPVRDSIRYITRFYGTVLQLKQLSEVARLSLYHFARVFRKETGMTPVQYLNRYRLEKAKRVLATSEHPITEVGRMVGIPNRFKFFHQFRALTGMSPEKYRSTAMRGAHGK